MFSQSSLHCAQAIEAMEAGKHVLLEIPMGLNLDESRRVVEAEKRTGKVCMVCHTQRFSSVFREIKERIDRENSRPYTLCSKTYFFRRKTKTASVNRARG